MDDEKKRVIQGVTKLIRLTQTGRLRWSASHPQGLAWSVEQNPMLASGVFGMYSSDSFSSKFKNRVLVLRAAAAPMSPSMVYIGAGGFASLELYTAEGELAYRFPAIEPLNDLARAVRLQLQGASLDKFLDELLAEPE